MSAVAAGGRNALTISGVSPLKFVPVQKQVSARPMAFMTRAGDCGRGGSGGGGGAAAPYPTEVGTAITGGSTSPPNTDGSAPSIPAAAMMTSQSYTAAAAEC